MESPEGGRVSGVPAFPVALDHRQERLTHEHEGEGGPGQPGLKVAVLLEGKNDIDALRSMATVLAAAGEAEALDETAIIWTIGGGDRTLKDWIERRYLEKLGVPPIVIQDSDRSVAAMPLSPGKAQWLRDMEALPNVTAFITRKRKPDNSRSGSRS